MPAVAHSSIPGLARISELQSALKVTVAGTVSEPMYSRGGALSTSGTP